MRQSFCKGEGIGWVWTWAIAVVAWSVNHLAIIGIFFQLSVYLWLLSHFCYKNVPVVKKVGLLCGSVLCALDYEKTVSLHYYSLWFYFYWLFLLFLYFLFFIFIDMFVTRSFFCWCGNTPSHIFFIFLYGNFCMHCI